MVVWIILLAFVVLLGFYFYLLLKILPPTTEYVVEERYMKCKENIKVNLGEIRNSNFVTYNTGDVVCFNPDGSVRFVYDHLGKKWR